MELGRRRRTEDALEFTKVTSSKVVFEIMQPIRGVTHEEFWIVYLNNSNKILSKA
jgi:DNA repair protein RadC